MPAHSVTTNTLPNTVRCGTLCAAVFLKWCKQLGRKENPRTVQMFDPNGLGRKYLYS